MAFTGNGVKLAGDDAVGKKATFGAEVMGDGAKKLPAGDYIVIGIAAVSGFPAAITTGTGTSIEVGQLISVISTDTITPAVGDNVVTMTLEDLCDISSFAMEFSKDEIETTTLCDSIKKYITGKADMAGSMNGLFTTGISDADDGFLRQFITVVKQDGDVSYSVFSQAESVLLGFFEINKTTKTDIMTVVAPYQLYGYGLGGEMGSAQSFSSSFKFTSLSYTSDGGDIIPLVPTFYRLGDGTA